MEGNLSYHPREGSWNLSIMAYFSSRSLKTSPWHLWFSQALAHSHGREPKASQQKLPAHRRQLKCVGQAILVFQTPNGLPRLPHAEVLSIPWSFLRFPQTSSCSQPCQSDMQGSLKHKKANASKSRIPVTICSSRFNFHIAIQALFRIQFAPHSSPWPSSS